jgi:teichuronic acid exporter
VEKITEVVHRVTPAVFSSVQREPAKLRRYLLHLTAGIALITFPATIGLGLVARDFVLIVLGQHWTGMIAPLQVLAFYAAFRSLTPLLPQVLIVIGETRFAMRAGMAAAVVLPFAFYVGSAWGTTGIAAAWALVHPAVVLPLFVRTFRRIHLNAIDYLRAILPAASGTILMAAVVILIDRQLSNGGSDVLILGAKVIGGAVTYAVSLFLFHRPHVAGYVRTLRLLRTQPPPHAGAPSVEQTRIEL